MAVKAKKSVLKFNYVKKLLNLKTYPNLDEEYLGNFKLFFSDIEERITA
jgi:hypothetical protein